MIKFKISHLELIWILISRGDEIELDKQLDAICERKRDNGNAMTKNYTYIERFNGRPPYAMLVLFFIGFCS